MIMESELKESPQLSKNGVCAVIVTFRPQLEVLGNLAKVRPQVQGLVVVDNGSSTEALAPFRAATGGLNFTLIENRDNLGIAAALNIGVRWARSQGYKWILLLDQDSTVTEGLTASMLAAYEAYPERKRVAILTPQLVNPQTGEEAHPFLGRDGNPLEPMTSGSLMPVSIFNSCGWFEEDLIIDCVDTEYALRVNSKGFIIILACRARLSHAIGSPQQYYFFGKRMFGSNNHSAARRYYISRNRTVMLLRYWKRHPLWCLHVVKGLLRDTAKIILAEECRTRKVLNTVRGISDGFTGRMGKVVEL